MCCCLPISVLLHARNKRSIIYVVSLFGITFYWTVNGTRKICCIPYITLNYSNTDSKIGMHTNNTQALGGRGKREPGIHCLRMRLISQKSWEIVNYRVMSVQSWQHNAHLPLHRPHIFYQQWKRFDRSLSCALQLPPTGSYFWCESQKSTSSY